MPLEGRSGAGSLCRNSELTESSLTPSVEWEDACGYSRHRTGPALQDKVCHPQAGWQGTGFSSAPITQIPAFWPPRERQTWGRVPCRCRHQLRVMGRGGWGSWVH